MNTPHSTPPGKLFLVPAPLDFGCDAPVDLEQTMPKGTLAVVARLQHWVCENAKSTRAYLKRVSDITPLAAPIQALNLLELPRKVHSDRNFDARPLLQAAQMGQDIGLVSEAGMPAVADPGSSVVRCAHEMGITVVPLVGPVSLLLALAASGLNGQNFAFVGYLPQDSAARVERIHALESLALKTGQTQMFIETPYRNQAMMQSLLQTLHPLTRLAISSGLTLERASIHSDSVKNWQSRKACLNNATPTVFAIGV